MFDDIEALFLENVVGALTDYLESRRSGKAGRSRDLRCAITAATALYHFREHLPSAFKKSRAEIVSLCHDYSLLGDVVNASKHRKLTYGAPPLDSADQIEERLIITEYQDEQGVYRHLEKRVILKPTNGPERDLLDVMLSVMNFWQVELVALGLISTRPSYVIPQDLQPRARAECNDGRLDIEAIQGVRFKQTFCLRKYNYDTGQVEPVDLTGANFEFKLYKPCYNFDIIFRNDRTGQVLKRTISLSDEEYQQLMSQQSDQERQHCLANLPQAQEAIRELKVEAHRIDASSGPQQPTET